MNLRFPILISGALLASFCAQTATAAPRDEVVAAFDKMIERGAFRMEMSTSDGRRDMTSTMDVQMPKSFHMRSEDTEFVMTPQGTWVNAGGNWMKMPVDMSKAVDGFTAEAMEDGKQAIGEVTYVGEGEVEGCTAKTYKYVASSKFMGASNDSDTTISICNDTGLPRLVESTESKKRRPTTVRVVYDFETPINIQPPR